MHFGRTIISTIILALLYSENVNSASIIKYYNIPHSKVKLKVVANIRNYPHSVNQYNKMHLSIRQTSFYRNGNPVFLLGIENFIPRPWTDRLLGINFEQFQLWQNSSVYNKKNNEVIFTLDTPKWLRRNCMELASNSIYPYVSIGINCFATKAIEKYLPVLCLPPGHHYFTLCPENPIVKDILKLRYETCIHPLSGFPILGVELDNEVYYQCTCQWNQELFRGMLQQKYLSIVNLNAAWRTSYASFDEIKIPHKFVAYKPSLSIPDEMFNEWIKFTEKRYGEVAKNFYAMAKSINPRLYYTIQAVGGGISGVLPREKAKGEDFYGAEYADKLFDEYITDNNLRTSFKFLMLRDYLSDTINKPIINEEGSFGTKGLSPKDICNASVIDLTTGWRFKSEKDIVLSPADNRLSNRTRTQVMGLFQQEQHTSSLKADIKSSAKWQDMSLDDSSWTKIKVPGLWGTQGFKNCVIGWYRKTFIVPEKFINKRLFLHGKAFADKAKIFLNGQLIMDTSDMPWNAEWSIDITKYLRKFPQKNLIACRLMNLYRMDNMFWGGIRGYIAITTFDTKNVIFGKNLMKTLLWSDLIHGISGRCIGYFYASGQNRISMFNPQFVSVDAVKYIPEFMRENEAISDVIIPGKGIEGKIAVFYPMETFRSFIPKSYHESMEQKWCKDAAGWYGALIACGIDTDVIDSEAILAGKLKKYKAVFFPLALRVPPEIIKRVEQFTENGGITVVDYGSFSWDDRWHRKLSTPLWFGLRTEGYILNTKDIIISDKDNKIRITQRLCDGTCGIKIVNTTAKVVKRFASSGTPAITLNQYGKGSLYYIGFNAEITSLYKIFKKILNRHAISGDFKIESNNNSLILERHRFVGKKREAWYLLNWNSNQCRIRIIPNFDIAETSYTIRFLETGKYILSSTGKSVWTASQLRKGITLLCPKVSPLVLIVEKINAKTQSSTLWTFGKNQKRYLQYFLNTQYIPGSKKILLLSESVYMKQFITPVNYVLREAGFTLNFALTFPTTDGKVKICYPEKGKSAWRSLSDYDVLFMPGCKFASPLKKQESKAIADYVKKGGVFVVFSYYGRDIRNQNYKRLSALLKPYGIRCSYSPVHYSKAAKCSPKEHPDEYMNDYFTIFSNIGKHSGHRVLKYVNNLVLGQTGVVNFKPSASEVSQQNIILRLPGVPKIRQKSVKGKACMITLKYGKGKIIVLAAANWLRGHVLMQEDNIQFLVNIFNFATGKKVVPVDISLNFVEP